MIDRNAKINTIVAMAIQAQSIEERQARRRDQARRAELDAAARYRRLAADSEQAFSTGFPTVCTIH
jgi:hypothetical protein